MEIVTVRIYSNESEAEKIVRIEKKYLALLEMIYSLVNEGYIFDYNIINEAEIVDFTK